VAQVIAIEIAPVRAMMCAHNVGGTAAPTAAAVASAANACFCFCFTVYGVSAYVDVVVGDYTKIWRRLKVARHTSHVTRYASHVTRLMSCLYLPLGADRSTPKNK